MIVEDLSNIGIRVVKDYTDIVSDKPTEEMVNSQWNDVNNKLSRGNFDMVLTGWQLVPAQDLSFAFHSSQIRAGSNFIRYRNPTMDKALSEAFNALDREES